MAGKTISFTIPRWTANLVPNLLGVLGLATVCVMLAFLTDWRWGGLLGGVFAVLLAGWAQWTATPAEVAKPTPIRKAA